MTQQAKPNQKNVYVLHPLLHLPWRLQMWSGSGFKSILFESRLALLLNRALFFHQTWLACAGADFRTQSAMSRASWEVILALALIQHSRLLHILFMYPFWSKIHKGIKICSSWSVVGDARSTRAATGMAEVFASGRRWFSDGPLMCRWRSGKE